MCFPGIITLYCFKPSNLIKQCLSSDNVPKTQTDQDLGEPSESQLVYHPHLEAGKLIVASRSCRQIGAFEGLPIYRLFSSLLVLLMQVLLGWMSVFLSAQHLVLLLLPSSP